MRNTLFAAIVTAAALALGPSHAQIDPFPPTFELTQGDREAITEAVTSILDDPNPTAGSSTEWGSQESGAWGSVDFIEALTIEGLSCRKLRYNINLKKFNRLHRYDFDYCQIEDGTWKSYP